MAEMNSSAASTGLLACLLAGFFFDKFFPLLVKM